MHFDYSLSYSVSNILLAMWCILCVAISSWAMLCECVSVYVWWCFMCIFFLMFNWWFDFCLDFLAACLPVYLVILSTRLLCLLFQLAHTVQSFALDLLHSIVKYESLPQRTRCMWTTLFLLPQLVLCCNWSLLMVLLVKSLFVKEDAHSYSVLILYTVV